MITHSSIHDVNSKTALITNLYDNGTDLYKNYLKYSNVIINNHIQYAKHNNFNYHVIGDAVLDHYDLRDRRKSGFHALHHCMGITKWYSALWLFENSDYEEIMFVDFDSIFLKNVTVNSNTHPLMLSPLYGLPHFDVIWLLYYCMYKNVSFTEFVNNTERMKYNSGIFKLKKGFLKQQDLEEFVDFAMKTILDIRNNQNSHYIHLGTTNLDEFWNIGSGTILTPFDEAFLMYLVIKNPNCYSLFGPEYNVNDINLKKDDTVHLHLYRDKNQLWDYCKNLVS